MEILYIVTVEVISILRVYALNPRDRLSPLAVVVLTLLAATYDTFTAVKSETIDGPLGCVVVPESPLYRPCSYPILPRLRMDIDN
ncbi:hypothetical protein EVJ58_g4348 [Rhodofomes roseus]|uniref:Uncharacterized protein n=1 Tax=Rhodofomes roseus TaxID=34475 RepID=A0A4Y9YI88_9APHY|nr:hypothetical protein EVJ58_g4348 [Rhodofomes roseus]